MSHVDWSLGETQETPGTEKEKKKAESPVITGPMSHHVADAGTPTRIFFSSGCLVPFTHPSRWGFIAL
jgi:hypothetical protein